MAKFLDISLHIGSRDIQYVFEQLGEELDVWSISDHHKIMGWERKKIDVVNQHTWQNLNQNICDQFYKRYKEELKDYDGFVSFYPPAFSALYEKFNKPIIMNIPIRYEHPFSLDKQRWNWFNDFLVRNKNKIEFIANNKYDQKYFEIFTGLKSNYIPSLCNYINVKYTGKNNKFLFCSKFNSFKNFIRNTAIEDKASLNNYSWQDMADYKAIIHLPYSNTIMSLFEQYSANIPLLFPTKRFLIQIWRGYPYEGVMSELSFNKIYNSGLNSSALSMNLNKENIPDPNDYKNEISAKYWFALSDFYDKEWMPYIEYYDSVQELEFKLLTLDFFNISKKMKQFNVERRQKILFKWMNVLNKYE